MSKQHTPTPWMKVSDDEGGFTIVEEEGYQPYFYSLVAQSFTDANAYFIVKACNNHDRLVEALEKTSDILHLLARVSVPDHFMDEALNVAKEVKKLLTELNTQ